MLYNTYKILEKQAKITLQNTAEILGENLVVPVEFDDAQSAELLLKTVEIAKNIDATFILKSKNEIFAHYIQDGFSGHPANV